MCRYLEMKAGHYRQLLHGELFGGLLVAATVATLDLSQAAQMLWLRESGNNTQATQTL